MDFLLVIRSGRITVHYVKNNNNIQFKVSACKIFKKLRIMERRHKKLIIRYVEEIMRRMLTVFRG